MTLYIGFYGLQSTQNFNNITSSCQRIVFNDYVSSYESLLNKVRLPTLHMSRLRCIATETYKCINNMTPEYLKDLVEVKQSNYSFRYENTVKIPTVRTVTYGQRSFRFESARV